MFPPCNDHLMSGEEFQLLRDAIYSHCGIHFDEDSRYLLEKRLSRRLEALNLPTFKDYYYLIKYGRNREQEMTDIMDLLTTNETYFFREAYQLKAFTDEIIPELVAAKNELGSKSLRIWSAGCSTGEEPYTIAMLLLEMEMLKGWNIEIIGTDISQRVLHAARHGVYSSSSFRTTDEYFVRRYFQQQEEGLRISDEVRQLVNISQLNLFDSGRIVLLGRMDVVFCRNVIIYFDNEAKKRVIESFYNTLQDGGFLLLGHSESLMNVSTGFTLRHFKNDMIYQKPARPVWGLKP